MEAAAGERPGGVGVQWMEQAGGGGGGRRG